MSNRPLKTIFMGTPEFACPGLKRLAENPEFSILAVISQPDKPAGRGQALAEPPVKALAKSLNIPVHQPLKIKEATEMIKGLEPDLIVVIAYGKIIPQAILDIPKHGCVNVHASLLPRYRGAACLNAPILNGDSETGVTIMLMDAGLDTGPVLKQEKISLDGKETLSWLHDRLSKLGAEALPDVLKGLADEKIKPQAQTETGATYVKMLSREDGKIDWTRPAKEIKRRIRGLNPWPGTFALAKNGKIVKILEADEKIPEIGQIKPGEIALENGQLLIGCGDGAIAIKRLQLEGGKPLDAQAFARGHRDMISQTLN